MQWSHAFVAVLSCLILAGAAPSPYGAQGAEDGPDRAQPWLVPTPDAAHPGHAVLFRPPGDGPFPLAVIAHASTQNPLRRAQMPQPDYRALAAWLVARGYAVLVPERLGHGATGGAYVEDQGGCESADYARSGRATAIQIRMALAFLQAQAFIRPTGAVVIGHSAGAWGALALAGDKSTLAVIIAFAPGRGGHAGDREQAVCAPQRLLAAAGAFGRNANVPVTWLVAADDSYFPPALSNEMADAFRAGGGRVVFRVLPATGSEGHRLPETQDGVASAAAELDRALTMRPAPGTPR